MHGSGLGVWDCDSLIHVHGGSVPGKGNVEGLSDVTLGHLSPRTEADPVGFAGLSP